MENRDEHNIATVPYTAVCRVYMYASSIIGTRKYQQDSFACIETGDNCLAVVCDGMGGLNGGERASQVSVETLMNDFIQAIPIDNCYNFFYTEAQKLDKIVYELKDEYGKPLGAGTTIVSVLVQKNRIHWLGVGDSKIYIIRNNILYSILPEHNYRMTLDRLLRSGQITPEKYRREEYRADALISFLGIGNVSLVEINEKPFELVEGDIIILCSDGLYKSLSEKQILGIVQDNYFDYQKAVNTLTRYALEFSGGAQDNTTAVLLSYH